MSNVKNDEKILLLKKQVEEKKAKVNKIRSYKPITNCMLNLHGENLNINVLNKDNLVHVLVVLSCYKDKAEQLEMLENYKIGSYLIIDWIEDIKGRLDVLSKQEEERSLKILENKLSAMLSQEKQVELELAEIENMLK